VENLQTPTSFEFEIATKAKVLNPKKVPGSSYPVPVCSDLFILNYILYC